MFFERVASSEPSALTWAYATALPCCPTEPAAPASPFGPAGPVAPGAPDLARALLAVRLAFFASLRAFVAFEASDSALTAFGAPNAGASIDAGSSAATDTSPSTMDRRLPDPTLTACDAIHERCS